MISGNSLTDLLIIYLYTNKYLSLPKLGRFTVSDEIDLSQPENIRFSRIPEGYISFISNPSEETDTELIRYITSHTRKMQSLAIADLFTLTDQARQMLNILQPVTFSGIGTLKKDAKGVISFTPGVYRPDIFTGNKSHSPKTAYSDKPTTTISSTTGTSHSSRSIGGIVIILICVIIAAGLLYFMFSHTESSENIQDISGADSIAAISPSQDTGSAVVQNQTTANKDSTPATSLPAGKIRYEVVFEHAGYERAHKRDSQLTAWGHKIIMRTVDSVHYTLAIPITSAPSDTNRIKDSLSVFFGKPTTIRYRTGK